MKLGVLLREAGMSLPDSRACELEITQVCSDTRRIEKGALFIALEGLHFDGARFVAEAFARGAAFVIAQRPLEGNRVMCVANARECLAKVLDAWYGHPARSLSLIGITGTNGKTSTATMLYHILRHAGYSVGLIGTVECRCNDEVLYPSNANALANMTTPDPEELYRLLYEMRERGATYVVMEVTSHALAFDKIAPLHFSRAVFTNLTPDHLDFHGDMEEYFCAKSRLFSMCDEATISFGTSYGARLYGMLEYPLYEVSSRTVKNVTQHGADGVSYTLALPFGGEQRVFVPVPGLFSVENSALAAMSALSLGVDAKSVVNALSCARGVRGRMERVETEADITVFLDYAHTPDALAKLLQSVRSFIPPSAHLTVLFGCGGDRDRSKRREMGRIASLLSDFVIVTSDNCRSEDPRAIMADIMRGVDKEKPHAVITDRKEAILYAVKMAKAGDTIVLAGKGHEEYEIKGNARLPFSEREIVKQAVRARRGE